MASVTPTAPAATNKADPVAEAAALFRKTLPDLFNSLSDTNVNCEVEAEELIANITADFVDSLVGFACKLVKQRDASVLEIRDVQMSLEKSWKMTVGGTTGSASAVHPTQNFRKPGYGIGHAHRKRLALVAQLQEQEAARMRPIAADTATSDQPQAATSKKQRRL